MDTADPGSRGADGLSPVEPLSDGSPSLDARHRSFPDADVEAVCSRLGYLEGRYLPRSEAIMDKMPAAIPAGAVTDRVHVVDRGSQLLFTAPHGGAPPRDSGLVFRDGGTGALAELLAERFGANLASTYGFQSTDPSRDLDHPFKRTVQLILPETQLLVDLHGMRDLWGVDVEIGLGLDPLPGGIDFADHLVEALRYEGLTVRYNEFLSAAWEGTMTSWSNRRGTAAIQVEVAQRLRLPLPGDRTRQNMREAGVFALQLERALANALSESN